MNKKLKTVLKIAKKSVRVRTLIFFILILVFNTCAWFIYISEVSSDITTRVKPWKIDIDNNAEQNLRFDVANIYPGMNPESLEVDLANQRRI